MKLESLFERKSPSETTYDVVKHKLLDNGEYGLAQIVKSGVSQADANSHKSSVKTELEKAGYIVRVAAHKSVPMEK